MQKIAPILKLITKKFKRVDPKVVEEAESPKVCINKIGKSTLRLERQEQEAKLEDIKEMEEGLEDRQKALIEKLAQKFTTSLAMKLFVAKSPSQEEGNDVIHITSCAVVTSYIETFGSVINATENGVHVGEQVLELVDGED